MNLAASNNWEVYAVNLLGCDSPLTGYSLGGISVDDYVGAVFKVVDEKKIDVVIGHSMGGLIAQKVASITNLKAAVFVSSAPPKGITVLNMRLVKMMIKYLWSMITYEPIIAKKEDLLALVQTEAERLEVEKLVDRLNPESGRAALEIAIGLVRVDKIRCATLVHGGRNDLLTTMSTQKKIALKYNSTILESECGHMPMIEVNQEKHWDNIHEWLVGALREDEVATRLLLAGFSAFDIEVCSGVRATAVTEAVARIKAQGVW